ncbi:MAG TPA: YbaB/EbfC family DNA-binding protein [Phytomonospora sp.]
MLSQTMAALGGFQAGQAAAGEVPEPAEPLEGYAESDDGLLVVRAAPPGRISGMVIDPRALRIGAEVLAEELTRTANAALTDLQEKSAALAGTPDFSGLSEQLKSIQESAGAQLNAFTNALVDAQERIAAKGGR